MAFYAWARGITSNPERPFIYPRRELIDEDDVYEMADFMEKLTRARGAGYDQVMNIYGNAQTTVLLEQQLTSLVTEGNQAQVWVGIHSGHRYDVMRFNAFRYQDRPETEMTIVFVQRCYNLGLRRWGILLGIARILGGYYAAGYGDPTLIRIEIDL
jgi:hypothetical protein